MNKQIQLYDMPSLCKLIETMCLANHIQCLVVDGPCASGKTTLANALSKHLNVDIISMDHFFLREKQRNAQRMLELGGNIDYERFIEEVLTPLHQLEDIKYRPYQCHSLTFDSVITIKQAPFIIIEGVYSHHPKFKYQNALKLYLDIDEQTQKQRLMKRKPALFNRFKDEWIPKEITYFKQFQIQEKADIGIQLKEITKEDYALCNKK